MHGKLRVRPFQRTMWVLFILSRFVEILMIMGGNFDINQCACRLMDVGRMMCLAGVACMDMHAWFSEVLMDDV